MRALCYLTLAVLTGIPAQAASRVVTVSVDSIVHPITTEILVSTFQYAATQDAELVLIQLNTPGGLLEATREIVEKIVAAPIPVVTHVTPSGGRAASAGFFILQAADIAAMAPGTNTGAASPAVTLGSSSSSESCKSLSVSLRGPKLARRSWRSFSSSTWIFSFAQAISLFATDNSCVSARHARRRSTRGPGRWVRAFPTNREPRSNG